MSLVFQENFDNGVIPSTFTTPSTPSGSVYVSQGSLVFSNPDHTRLGTVGATTNPNMVQLTAPNTYLLTFDWSILETVDLL